MFSRKPPAFADITSKLPVTNRVLYKEYSEWVSSQVGPLPSLRTRCVRLLGERADDLGGYVEEENGGDEGEGEDEDNERVTGRLHRR